MNQNNTIDIRNTNPSAEQINPLNRPKTRAVKRRLNPWHLLGWLRKQMKSRPNRQFHSRAEKLHHQYDRMAQRAATHHHGFKF